MSCAGQKPGAFPLYLPGPHLLYCILLLSFVILTSKYLSISSTFLYFCQPRCCLSNCCLSMDYLSAFAFPDSLPTPPLPAFTFFLCVPLSTLLPKSSLTIQMLTLAGVAKLIECQPVNQGIAGLIPSQGTCLGCRPGPQWGASER